VENGAKCGQGRIGRSQQKKKPQSEDLDQKTEKKKRREDSLLYPRVKGGADCQDFVKEKEKKTNNLS